MRSTLDDFARRAADRMGPDTVCSVTMDDEATVQQVASNDPRAAAVDQVETRTGEGPCIVAMNQLSAVLVEDIDRDDRWPIWRQAALTAGFRSAAALPAYVTDTVTVAFNMYSEDLDVWASRTYLDMDAYVQDLATAMQIDLPQ